VSLQLYDTATRSVRPFTPIEDGRVGVYLCGATVQAAPHIGHIRSGLVFDVLQRWLTHRGYDVTFVRNVTDIDDKILAKSAEAGIPWWAWATRYERSFTDAYDVLGCQRPTHEPRATGHVTEMVSLMDVLTKAGHAYVAEDGSGDVYFDVRSWPRYGELSGQRVDDMEAAADADPRGKRDPRDFALWKGSKPDEPETASWPTPWGPGRPGWHLECSAMAGKYLGDAFDIHGGGLDLRFPHHENELAQSAAAGREFARYWVHNAWVTTAGEKMSKSLGNSLLVSEIVRRVRPIELRYYLVAPHYRSNIEYSDESLAEAGVGFRRVEGFLERAVEAVGLVDPGVVPDAFAAAMDDDLGVPAAVAVMHDGVREGNARLAAADEAGVRRSAAEVRAMLGVLGLDPFAEPWASRAGGEGDSLRAVVDGLVGMLLDERARARQARDFAAADAIRDRLAALGVAVEDTPAGPRWTVGAPAPTAVEGSQRSDVARSTADAGRGSGTDGR
jgi:cysteinyl-tRNA synthetase